MFKVPSSDVRGWVRRAGFVAVTALCATALLAGTASATSVAAKKTKPKPKSSSSLKTIANSLKADENATFSASYNVTTPSVKTPLTFAFAQKPPNFQLIFKEAGVSVTFVKIGSKAYGCEATAAGSFCAAESTSTVSSDLGFFEPNQVLPKIEAMESGATGVVTSSKTFAGQPSKCVSATYAGTKATYCVTDKGILAYAGTASTGVTLTGYSSSPPASDFALPAGAKVTTP
jgi:hypothetical protein